MKLKYILFSVFIICLEAVFLCAQSKENVITVQNPELRRVILEIFHKDQAIIKEIRDKEVRGVNLTVSPEDERRRRAIEDAHTNRVKQIVEQYGFPTNELIGKDGVNALNTLVLHAIRDPAFQTYYLGLLQKAVENKQVPGREVAYLTDKIRLNAGKQQLYGTQPLSDAKGNIGSYPIKVAANVDKRRAAIGMEPLEEYLNVIHRLSREQEERIYKEDNRAAAQTSNSQNKEIHLERTKKVIQAEIQKLLRETGIPSISLALVERDKIVWADASGEANVQTRSLANSETLYNTGSTFKTITAIALMQQLERKKISLDNSIAPYIGDIKIKDLSANKPVSFRQLLSHTSGLMGPSGMKPLWKRDSLLTLTNIASRIVVKREPGKAFEYCNACYALAGLLVERISGQFFPEYVTEHIFKPLGIQTPEPFEPTAEMAEKIAFPYSLWNNRPEAEERLRFDAYPAGDAYLTPSDMGRVVGALLNEGSFNGLRILNAETVKEMRRQQLPATDYGLGIELTEKIADNIIMHTGSLPGFSVIYRGDTESRVGIYLVANAGAMQSALDALSVLAIKLMRGEQKIDPLPGFAKTETYTVAAVAKEVLKRYSGIYRLTPTLFVTIVEERGRLLMQSDEGINFRLIPISEKSFVVKELSARLTFNLNAGGSIQSLTWSRAGRDTVAPKVK